MRCKNILIFFLLIESFCTFNVKAQKLDSLLKELNNHLTEDTIRLKLLIAAGIAYERINPEQGVRISDSAIILAKELHVAIKLADAYNTKAANYFLKADYSDALQWFQRAMQLYREQGIQKGVANAYSNIGNLYTKWGDYFEALDYYENALKIYTGLNLKNYELFPLGNISRVYILMSNIPKALEYSQKSLSIAESVNDVNSLPTCYNNMGDIYSELSDFKTAATYFKKSYNLSQQTGNKRGEAGALQKIGDSFLAMADYDKALDYQTRSMKLSDESGFKDITLYCLVNIGDIYVRLADYGNAIKYYEKASPIAILQGNKRLESAIQLKIGESLIYASDSVLYKNNIQIPERHSKAFGLISQAIKNGKEIANLELQRDAYSTLTQLDSAKGDHIKALEDYKNYIIIRDSILNNRKRKEIEHLSMQYEFSKKEDSLNLQQQVTAEKLKQQVLLTQQEQQQLILNQKGLELSNKEKDLQKLAYFKTQADLQNEQLERQKGEKQLTIVQKEKELQNSEVKNLSQQQALSKLRLQQQWFYSIGILILLAATASFFIYRNRAKQDKLKRELAKEKEQQEKREAEFQRKLADVSLTALRSQMNPHFIFNCLNSIKLYTTQNDVVAASEYLTKFSKLIRLVMENSRNDRISLTSELNALRLYIEMEAMRFKEKLQYDIKINNDVEADYIEIPPLLLQPYVENAIWHGLMHKEEGGKIDINAAIHKEESVLEINIIDDGVGRSRSAELRSKTATRHKSYGMKVTSERIALINQIYKTGANVSIHDLLHDNGQPAGTLVTIQIPV